MAEHRPELYRWERVSKPRVYSRTQRVTDDNDIQSWIKKVEAASDRAAAEAFGQEAPPSFVGGRVASKAAAQATVENVLRHESAYNEAQELIQQWMNDKVHLSDDDDAAPPVGLDDDYNDYTARRKTRVDIKREWDHLVAQNETDYGLNLNHGNKSSRSDPYSILEQDTDSAVDDILTKMLRKEVIKDEFKLDIGLDDSSKIKDPTTKMKLRHQQVKENREKRMKEVEKKKREQQAKKEAEFKARQLVKQEETQKKKLAKLEEEEITAHMARLRKQMSEQRQREEEQKKREKMEKEQFEIGVQEEYERQKQEEEKKKIEMQLIEENRKRKIQHRLAQVETEKVTQNLKLLQRCFSSWYDIVVQRRLSMGKARALADWRLMSRAWRAWRGFARTVRLDRDEQLHRLDIQIKQQKEAVAHNHHRLRLLRRCFLGWTLYVSSVHHKRELAEEQGKTRSKMAAFLQAAASGGLHAQDDGLMHSQSMEDVSSELTGRLDSMFNQQPHRRRGSESARTDASSMTSARSHRSRSNSARGVAPPKEAFQKRILDWMSVRREHVKLSKDQIKNLTPGQHGDEGGDQPSKESTSPAKSAKKAQAVSIIKQFEHRHNNQQKILENQQKQIKQQQRLIEEMQYLQRQQLLQQQATNQHMAGQLIQQGDGSHGNGSSSTNKMTQHLSKLQRDMVLEGETTRSDVSRQNAINDMFSDGKTNRSDLTTVTAMESDRSDQTTDRTTTTARSKASTGSTNSRHVNFLKTMDERAQERARIKQEREERKRKEEDEKLARLQAEAEARKQEEAEAKQRRIEEYRLKKQQDKQREQEKQAAAERLAEQHRHAEHHHQVALLRYRGWLPWQRLMHMAREKREQAEEWHRTNMLRTHLQAWHRCVRGEVEQKEKLADQMYKYVVIKRCFANWKKVGELAAIEEEKAVRFHTSKLRYAVFTSWREYTDDQKIAMWHKERAAKEHNIRRIQKKYFNVLRFFPEMLQEQKEREKRKAELRRKVASLLPDFEASDPVRVSASIDDKDL